MLALRFTLLFLLNAILLSAQPFLEKGGKHQIDPGSRLIRKAYHYTVEKNSDKLFVYKQFFPETKQLTHLISYKDAKRRVKHGRNAEWYDDGILIFDGHYDNNQKTGPWIESIFGNFYTYYSGEYLDDKKTGKWIQSDSAGVVKIITHYKEGLKDGGRKYFDKEGVLTLEEVYAKDELVEVIFEKEAVADDTTTMKVVEIMPSFPGCEALQAGDPEIYKQCSQNKMLQYVYKSIRYPNKARKKYVEGMAIVRFVVNKEGGIERIKILRGLCASIQEQCLQVVENMPQWHPGMQRNKPVKVYFNLPIRFKLE